MNEPSRSTGQWMVVVRAPGEILTAAAPDSDIELGLLGVPEGYTSIEIQGWLSDLAGVARETSREDTETRPIPAILHHGLTGLLFSHEQLWNREGQPDPCSYAAVHSGGWIGFGWTSDVVLQVMVDGELVEPEPVIVRDEGGREACAFVLSDRHAVRLSVHWPAGADAEATVMLHAEWQGAQPQAGATGAAAEHEATTAPDAAPLEDDASPGIATEPIAPPEPMEAPAIAQAHAVESGSVVDPFDAPFEDEIEYQPMDPASFDPIPDEERHEAPARARSAMQPQTTLHSAGAEAAVDAVAIAAAADTGTLHVPDTIEPQPDTAVQLAVEELGETSGDPGGEPFDDTGYEGEDDQVTPRKGGGLRRLFSRLAFWRKDEAAPAGDAAIDESEFEHAGQLAGDVPGVPDLIPPTPEPAELTERAVQVEIPPVADTVEPSPGELPAIAEGAAGPDGTTRELDPATEIVPPAEHAHTASPPDTVVDELPVPTDVDAEAPVAPARYAQASTLPAELDATAEHAPAAVVDAETDSIARVPRRPEWPSAEELRDPPAWWKRPWAWAAFLALLFAGGWMLGNMQTGDGVGPGDRLKSVARGLGLGGARFDVMVNSRPPGAWISVDGKDIARRTPASIELPPGEHEVALSFSDLGSAAYAVRGVDGDQLSVDATLWGSLRVYSSDSDLPVAVSVDGQPRGFAPLSIDSLAPGAHELRFSGPGLPSWGQTVEVRVQEPTEVVARPMTSPATGVIEVRATLATATGADPLEGGTVWVDGVRKGRTPLTLELPRGPHSIRVEHAGESTPVQVIDLPGGNQRFAHFQLGLNRDAPRLLPIDAPARVPLNAPTTVSVALDGVLQSDLREMWLHVQTPDGPWRRYQMAILKTPGGVVGVVVFPTTMFDEKGEVRYYASGLSNVGDEYYTEIQTAAAERPGRR